MSKMINIEELHREQEKKDDNKREIFTTILEMVHDKIRFTNKVSNDKFCFFVVPTYVYGLPLFNVNNCIIYLTKKLTENGFDIRFTSPNLLLINWLEKPKNPSAITYGGQFGNKLEDARKKAIEYKPITDYQPQHNFVYDANAFNNSLNTLQDKANKLLYDPRF
jgi:hypothetical protein